MKVLVLGAGVVGVAAAYYLARHGLEVEVVDRQPGPALETSFANGGQISASHAEPWANPDTPRKILKWMGRKDAPLLFHLRLDPALWAWGLRFLANCPAARARINIERTLRVALYSRTCLAELRAETGIAYDQRTAGILHFYRDPQEYDHAARQVGLMADLGCRRETVDVDACIALEPTLALVRNQLAGGIFSPDDESGDAHLFTRRLADLAAGLGVVFRHGVTIRGLAREGDRITGIATDAGILTADRYLVALGSYSPLLLRPLGLPLPIYPAKGYSVTLPLARPDLAPTLSLTDDEHKLVFSRLGENLRVAGTAEMTGWDTSLNETRARLVLNQALDLFPGCADPARATLWTGLRPKTPDSVPILGATRLRNLFLDTGHGTLGWTMACGSGRAMADLLAGREPEIDLAGLGMDRFS
ncbi:MAG: D-amino acid dehydrogenase [Magnetospirillum sp. WYHS-4]